MVSYVADAGSQTRETTANWNLTRFAVDEDKDYWTAVAELGSSRNDCSVYWKGVGDIFLSVVSVSDNVADGFGRHYRSGLVATRPLHRPGDSHAALEVLNGRLRA